jgi:ferredoxin
MRASVDRERCEAHEKCVAIAPEIFELADDGFSHVKLADIPEGLRPKVERAVRLCPRQAIGIAEGATP